MAHERWGFSNIKRAVRISGKNWLSPTYDINLPSCYGSVGDTMENLSKTGYRCFAELRNYII